MFTIASHKVFLYTRKMKETWKPIPGFEHYYECSDLGRIRSKSNHNNHIGWRYLKARPTPRGYLIVCLFKDRQRNWMTVHRIVFKTFIGNIPNGFTINHKNGIKIDNKLSNLESATHSYNITHSYRSLGKKPPNNPNYGEKNGSAKLTRKQVQEIKEKYAKGDIFQKALANEYGVRQCHISRIVRGESWAK